MILSILDDLIITVRLNRFWVSSQKAVMLCEAFYIIFYTFKKVINM